MEQIPSDISVSNAPSIHQSQEPIASPQSPSTERAERLTYEEQLKIAFAIATHVPNDEILKLCRRDFGKETTTRQVYAIRQSASWKDKIQKFRDEFEAEIFQEELASKRRRIQEMSKAYWRLQKDDANLSRAVPILGMIREEIEGKTSSAINLTQYNQFNKLSDEDLRKVISENSRFLGIVKNSQTIDVTEEPKVGQGN